MNRIRYILDLSNITPPENTAGDLMRAYDGAMSAAKKKKRAATITLAAALLALALSAAVFFIAKRNGQNEKPNDPAPSFTGIPVIGFDPDSVGLTEFVMTYTDLSSQSLVIPFNRTDELYGYFENEKKYADVTDRQIARTIYFGADGFTFAELYSGPLSRVSFLPDGMRTLTLGACRRGTFIYLLTLGVHVVPISLPDADADGAAPCARLEDADGGDAGELYFNGTSYYARFSDRFPWESSLRIFKIRYEHNNAVIYDVTEPETVPIDGVYRCRTDGGVFEFTADPSLLSPEGYGGRLCDYPITADLCREEFSPEIIRLIINKYGLEWFVPAAVTDRKDFYDHFTCLDFTKLVEASTLDDVLAALEDTPYRDTLRRVQNQGGAGIFRYETALDLFHFSAIWKEKDELPDSSAKSLALFYGTKFDLLNIWFIYRARTNFRMDTSGIYALTIPVLYRLSKKDIMAMVEAPDGAAFADAVRNTWYGGRYPALAPDNLQYMYTEIMREIIRAEARRNPYSTAMPYYYLYWKEPSSACATAFLPKKPFCV